MKVLVTGAAGFIGSNLTDRLLADGHEVVGFDNLSSGQMEFLQPANLSARFKFVRGDLLDGAALAAALPGVELVFHFAANADVRFGTSHPRKDLEQNTQVTANVLEAMRSREVRRIAFSSTGLVYGEPKVFPTPEDAPFPVQTSLYGASKTAAEGLISAYCEGFGFQAYIFRFVSILGERYSHGHVFDFGKQLLENPAELRVLGDGTQRKSYLYIQDCLDAVLMVVERATERLNIFNLGTEEWCEIRDSIRWISEYLRVSPHLEFTGGDRGWVGDSPRIILDCSRIRSLGWKPKLSIQEGVIRTIQFLDGNRWLFEKR